MWLSAQNMDNMTFNEKFSKLIFNHVYLIFIYSRVFNMASTSSDSHSILQKLINNLSTDLRQLSNETKKKYPPIKEVEIIP